MRSGPGLDRLGDGSFRIGVYISIDDHILAYVLQHGGKRHDRHGNARLGNRRLWVIEDQHRSSSIRKWSPRPRRIGLPARAWSRPAAKRLYRGYRLLKCAK